MPIERAVPRMVFDAASTEEAFMSGIFCVAISRICFSVTLPSFSLFGVPEPLGIPAAFSSNTGAGGVFVINENVRSAYTVMTTGIVRPAIAGSLLVRSLNCLQNSMMLTCAWPSAGPTGGAGVALAAMIWSLTYPVIFFGAMCVILQVLRILCCGQEVEDRVKRPDGLLRNLAASL